MGAKPTTIGGGSATGVSDEWAKMLMTGLSQGFGTGAMPGAQGSGQTTAGDAMSRANPTGSTMNIAQAIGNLLNNGDSMANGAMSIANNRRQENVADLRSRYALGGTGYGTPAASAEARFLGEFDPQVATQIGQMRMDNITKALSLIIPGYMQSQQIGTPQAQTVMKPSGFTNFISGLGQVAGVAAQFFPGGNPLGAGSNGPSPSVSGGQLGQASRYNFDGTHTNKIVQGEGNAFSGYGNYRNSFGQSYGY